MSLLKEVINIIVSHTKKIKNETYQKPAYLALSHNKDTEGDTLDIEHQRDYAVPQNRKEQAVWLKAAFETPVKGSLSFRSTLNIFTNLIIGDYPEVSTENGRLYAFITGFFKYNNLNDTGLSDLITLAAVHNFVTFSVTRVGDTKNIKLNLKTPIDIKYSTEDMLQFDGYPGSVKSTTLFGSFIGQFIRSDEILSDLAKTNKKASRLTPFLKVTDEPEAIRARKSIESTGWKIGDMLVGTGDLSFVSPETGAIENMLSELSALAKQVQHRFGIPVHWLGWVKEMSNRATAEELHSIMQVVTATYRIKIVNFLRKIVDAAIILSQDSIPGGIQEKEDYTLTLAPLNLIQFQEFMGTLLKLKEAGVMSSKEVRVFVPNMDDRRDVSDAIGETNAKLDDTTTGEEV